MDRLYKRKDVNHKSWGKTLIGKIIKCKLDGSSKIKYAFFK